jgi:DNA-binding transcriptional LysR family regulator
MNLRQLEMFRAVRLRGSLSSAARHLDVTQPAVSSQMKQLRRELGVPLLRLDGRRLELTEAGEELFAYAERILSLLEEARSAVRARGEAGHLIRVAASSTPGVSLLPPLIRAFRSRFPGTRVRLEVTNTERVEDRVRKREADVGIVGGRLASTDLAAIPWRQDELVLIVAADHRLAGRRSASPSDLVSETLLAREHGSATRTTYEAAFLSAGAPLPEPEVVGDTEAIKRAVAAGIGVAIVSRASVADEVREGKLRQLRIRTVRLVRPLHILLPSTSARSRAVAAFVKFVRAARR